LIGPAASRVSDLDNEIATALCRTGWIKVKPPPSGRYQLYGRVSDDGGGKLRVNMRLLDQSAGRYIWADSAECVVGNDIGFRGWLSSFAAGAVRSIVRDAEINRALRQEATSPTAWKLSMRALSMVMAADPAKHPTAMELLDRAVELAPRDPVPMALSAWCRGQRAGHHFTGCQQTERQNALRLAADASAMSVDDPLADTMLSAAYMLAHDLAAAEAHARRALSIDGGSAWGWGRLAWVHAYRGDAATAIEYFKIAHVLGPDDPLGFLWSIGIAAANFELGGYDRAVQWYQRALVKQPRAIWINRFLAPASLLADKKDGARQSFAALRQTFPDLTIAEVRTGLPHTSLALDRVCDGLASLGMPHG
jgi:tetratricopeptide (TPR) repeat protein